MSIYAREVCAFTYLFILEVAVSRASLLLV